jgi:adenylate cyclase
MTTVRFRLIESEGGRSARERPSTPDFADVMLRAMSNQINLAPNPQNRAEVISLYEHAVTLDPNAIFALAGLAEALLDTAYAGWPREHPNTPAIVRRAEEFIRRAETLRPDSSYFLYVKVYLLWLQRRCGELIPTARRAIELHPSVSSPYFHSGLCMLHEGRAAEAIPLFEQSVRVHPRNPQLWYRHLFKGRALLLLARYDEAVDWLNAAMASLPSAASAETRATVDGWIAAAQALAGQIDEARATAAEANRVWPLLTVRSSYPSTTGHEGHDAPMVRVLDALRLVGIRDHVDEEADPGLEPDSVLHDHYQGLTPTSVPGARTVRTAEVAVMLERRRPLVIDTKAFGKSIPGAVGLSGAGIGGALSDEYQARLKQKMDQLTRGNRTVPIITVGVNAERFEARNLALRLAVLGYTGVYWYRGGREAWEVAGLPTTDVVAQDW